MHDEGEFPVEVRLRYVAGERAGEERTIRAKYVAGCDGARSGVREAIGRKHVGGASSHAWGVMDVMVNTDFPDWRTKCAINAAAGNILHIPREGGYLSRVYVDLGAVAEDDDHRVRLTSIDEIIRRANEILHPYTLDVKEVAWHSVYEVGHRVTDKFDDVPDGSERAPRVFLTGDACHTHSAKAGQGMNVSMQDGFNLGWKLGAVLTGRSPETLLATYSAERLPVAQQLIDFDREWSTLMARKPEEISDPQDLATYYLATAEFPSGFMTRVRPVRDRRGGHAPVARRRVSRSASASSPPRSYSWPTATPCISATTRRRTGGGVCTRSRMRPQRESPRRSRPGRSGSRPRPSRRSSVHVPGPRTSTPCST